MGLKPRKLLTILAMIQLCLLRVKRNNQQKLLWVRSSSIQFNPLVANMLGLSGAVVHLGWSLRPSVWIGLCRVAS